MTTPSRKRWWQSWTLHVNALAAILAALEAQAHLLSAVLPPGWQPWGMLGLAVTNAYLRAVTTQPICWRGDTRHHEQGR